MSQSKTRYMLPEKPDELDRLHLQHAVFKVMLQGNIQAPVIEQLEKGIKVLDSGCGPGAWTFDVAKDYPKSNFYGVDITTNSLPQGEVPENCQFAIANVAEKLPYPDNYFDYVYQRLLIFGLNDEDWDKALKEIYRVVKPGGYVEFAEMSNDPVNIGPKYKALRDKMGQFMKVKKMCENISTELNERIPATGFVDHHQIVAKLQINHTDKAGEIYWRDCKHVFTNLQPFVAMANPEWANPETYEKYLDDCGEECKELKTSSQYYIYYAQKPF